MVCDKCEKKLTKLATPDVWNVKQQNQKKVATHMILPGFSKNKFDPIGNKCIECKKKTIPKDEKLCQPCAYAKGKCKLCGDKILEIKFYK